MEKKVSQDILGKTEHYDDELNEVRLILFVWNINKTDEKTSVALVAYACMKWSNLTYNLI